MSYFSVKDTDQIQDGEYVIVYLAIISPVAEPEIAFYDKYNNKFYRRFDSQEVTPFVKVWAKLPIWEGITE